MSKRITGPAPVAAADTSTTGVKLTYTCPAGKFGTVKATSRQITGTATIQLRRTRGGVTIVFATTATVGATIDRELHVIAGDVIDFNVSAAVAGTADLDISAEEQDV